MNTNLPNLRRGEVWDLNFNPMIGSEIQKTRLAVVISSDGVGQLPIKLVSPITGWQDRFLRNIWHVRIEPSGMNGLTKLSVVDTLQIRGVDVKRFISRRGRLSVTLMQQITAATAAIIEHQ